VNITLRVWRQDSPSSRGGMVSYGVDGVSPDMSFLEVLDTLNERLTLAGDVPIAFDSDCREGICGSCGLVIDGVPHGPLPLVTTCQLHVRSFADGAVIDVEPWRAAPFTVVKDLVVDRGALDRIIAAGGYISVPTGAAPEAHAVPVAKATADHAFDAATCMVEAHDDEGFGGCTQIGECTAVCPQGIGLDVISRYHHDVLTALIHGLG
jgi:succinate dehydrogenase / fumarate reductase iron-sulfur subunit